MSEKDFFKDATLGDIFTRETMLEFAKIMQPLIQTKLIEEAEERGRLLRELIGGLE